MSPGEVWCWAEDTAQPQWPTQTHPGWLQGARRTTLRTAGCSRPPACPPALSAELALDIWDAQLGLTCFPTPCPNPTEF